MFDFGGGQQKVGQCPTLEIFFIFAPFPYHKILGYPLFLFLFQNSHNQADTACKAEMADCLWYRVWDVSLINKIHLLVHLSFYEQLLKLGGGMESRGGEQICL